MIFAILVASPEKHNRIDPDHLNPQPDLDMRYERLLRHVDSNGQRNTLICRSRTGVSSMKQRKRIYYSEVQKAEMWDRWQRGDSMHAIARAFD
ncbi:MAG: hypothetical protein ACI955_002029 [Zhongshania sp.]